MKVGIVAIGVILMVLGIFLFITGYQRIATIPWFYGTTMYRDEVNVGQLMEILGGILTAIGLGLVVLGALKKDKGRNTIPPPP